MSQCDSLLGNASAFTKFKDIRLMRLTPMNIKPDGLHYFSSNFCCVPTHVLNVHDGNKYYFYFTILYL